MLIHSLDMREFDGIDVEYADMDVSALTLPTPDDLIDLEAEELEKFSSVNHSPAVKLLVKAGRHSFLNVSYGTNFISTSLSFWKL